VRCGLQHQEADADDLQKGIEPFLCLFFAQEIRALFKNLKQIAAKSQTNPVILQPNLA